jgi:hypothetical protein
LAVLTTAITVALTVRESTPAAAASSSHFIEVHQGGGSDLWYHDVTLPPGGTAGFGPSHWFASGFKPQVASWGNAVVAVYQSSSGAGNLMYRVGRYIVGTGRLLWTVPQTFAWGADPRVALVGASSGSVDPIGTVIVTWTSGSGDTTSYRVGALSGGLIAWADAHSGLNSVGGLPVPIAISTNGWIVASYSNGMGRSIRVGQLNGDGIDWTGFGWSGSPYDASVAIFGSRVVEVAGNSSVGTVRYRLGTLSGGGLTLDGEAQYDNGFVPSVTFLGTTANVVEVHQGSAGAGGMWSRQGSVGSTSITWTGAQNYDNGGTPSIG